MSLRSWSRMARRRGTAPLWTRSMNVSALRPPVVLDSAAQTEPCHHAPRRPGLGRPFNRLHGFQIHLRPVLVEQGGQPLRVVVDERVVDILRPKARMQQHEIRIGQAQAEILGERRGCDAHRARERLTELVAAMRPRRPVHRRHAAGRVEAEQSLNPLEEVFVRLPDDARHQDDFIRSLGRKIVDGLPLRRAIAAKRGAHRRRRPRRDRRPDGRDGLGDAAAALAPLLGWPRLRVADGAVDLPESCVTVDLVLEPDQSLDLDQRWRTVSRSRGSRRIGIRLTRCGSRRSNCSSSKAVHSLTSHD